MIDSFNQTQFAQEEPIYEAPVAVPVDPQAEAEPKSKNPLKWVLIGVGAFLGLIIIVAIVVKLVAPGSIAPQSSPDSPSDMPTQVLSGFEQRLSELNQELEAADPSKDTLPFPPVKMDLPL